MGKNFTTKDKSGLSFIKQKQGEMKRIQNVLELLFKYDIKQL